MAPGDDLGSAFVEANRELNAALQPRPARPAAPSINEASSHGPEPPFVQSARISPATSPVRVARPAPLITWCPMPSPATSGSLEGSRALEGLELSLDSFELLARESPLALLELMQGGALTKPVTSSRAEAAGLIRMRSS